MASSEQRARGARKLIDQRREMIDDDEPIISEERTVQKHGNGLYVNPTKTGCSVLNIEKGSDVFVAVYPDGVWIGRGELDE